MQSNGKKEHQIEKDRGWNMSALLRSESIPHFVQTVYK
jgi:hypothetical protein